MRVSSLLLHSGQILRVTILQGEILLFLTFSPISGTDWILPHSSMESSAQFLLFSAQPTWMWPHIIQVTLSSLKSGSPTLPGTNFQPVIPMEEECGSIWSARTRMAILFFNQVHTNQSQQSL